MVACLTRELIKYNRLHLDNQFDPAKNTHLFSSIFSSPNGLYWDLNSIPCPSSPTTTSWLLFITQLQSAFIITHQAGWWDTEINLYRNVFRGWSYVELLSKQQSQPWEQSNATIRSLWLLVCKEAFFPLSPCIPPVAGDCQLCRLSYTWGRPGLTEESTGINHMRRFSYPATS